MAKFKSSSDLSFSAQLMLEELSVQDRSLLSEPTIKSRLPISFKGGLQFNDLNIFCGECKKQVDSDKLFGRILDFNEKMRTIDAIGMCQSCNRFVIVNYRLHDNGDVSGYSPEDGVWRTWKSRPLPGGIVSRIKRFIFGVK